MMRSGGTYIRAAMQEDKHSELTALFRSGMEGNGAAYNVFLTAIAPLLRRVIGRRLASADIEDVVQEVLISIHKARHTYDGDRPIMPWILSISRFRINDHLRRHYAQMRHQTIDIGEIEAVLCDVTEGGDERESLIELLEGVPEKQRKILTMMHMEGHTAKEVGQQLGMNESAVKVAAHRAIKQIRKKFSL
ncbi:MAG: sigma-70 family RNA polymerase sigma factor [Alphaproteobacteria bacterium]|nr:sigma-70 family RNA polymerase sigma factor [Alphaproteobacteria bacterium]